MQKKIHKKNKKITQIKTPKKGKDLMLFLTSEEGKIAKKKAAKLAVFLIGASAALGGLMQADSSLADCAHANHSSHASHDNGHGNGGWCV